jgi:hypothetical protein
LIQLYPLHPRLSIIEGEIYHIASASPPPGKLGVRRLIAGALDATGDQFCPTSARLDPLA